MDISEYNTVPLDDEELNKELEKVLDSGEEGVSSDSSTTEPIVEEIVEPIVEEIVEPVVEKKEKRIGKKRKLPETIEGEEAKPKKKRKKTSNDTYDKFRQDAFKIYKDCLGSETTAKSLYGAELSDVITVLDLMDKSRVSKWKDTLINHFYQKYFEYDSVTKVKELNLAFLSFYNFVVYVWVEKYKKNSYLDSVTFGRWNCDVQTHAIQEISPFVSKAQIEMLRSLMVFPHTESYMKKISRVYKRFTLG